VGEAKMVTGARLIAVEMDDFQTAILFDRTQARRLAKSLLREANRGTEAS
jgi:hypothetical protein